MKLLENTLFAISYFIRIILSLLWYFNINKVDFKVHKSEEWLGDGYYYKNIFTYWQNKKEYSKDLDIEQKEERKKWD